MGKKNKLVLNDDPILSKNFKYEKRKNQKQLQKLKQQEEKLQEDQKVKCLKQIERSVEKQINQLYAKQVQKHKLMSLSIKKKHAIQKANFRTEKTQNKPMLNCTSKQKNMKFLQKNNNSVFCFLDSNSDQEQKRLQQLEQNNQHNQNKTQITILKHPNYVKHFIPFQKIPLKITNEILRQKRLSALQRIQTQVKNQIKEMFKVKELGKGQTIEDEIHNRYSKNKKQALKEEPQNEQNMQVQQTQNQPYIFRPKTLLKAEKDINILQKRQTLISAPSYSANSLIFQSPNLLLTTLKQQQLTKIAENNSIISMQAQIQGEAYEKVIQSYKDYLHIQNKQEETIDGFRSIVINHMYNHYVSQQELSKLKDTEFAKQKGFTMAKFLILAPYAGDAKAIAQQIQSKFTSTELTVKSEKKKLFGSQQWTFQNQQKLEQLQDQNDFFRFGIKIIPKKQKIYYFANFDTADIIIASPLGLKAIINSTSEKNKQNSFLSSVEILYIDRASVMLMQNWDHLIEVVKNLNYMPRYQSLKNSIDQIRQTTLSMKGRIYRQSIVFSEFQFPQLNALKINYFHNYEGCLTLKHIYSPLILQVNQNLQKNFYKIQLKEPKQDLTSRFQYFKRKFWDKLHNNQNVDKIIVFSNSYFQYIKLKSFFEKVNASAQCICEHTKKQKIQSRLANFNNNKFRILLLTERAFYFGLCQIKKFKQIYFYSLPKNSFIYKILIESVITSSTKNIVKGNNSNCVFSEQQNKVVCIYSKYDKPILERIVGSVKAGEMLRQYCSNVNFII